MALIDMALSLMLEIDLYLKFRSLPNFTNMIQCLNIETKNLALFNKCLYSKMRATKYKS